MLHFPMRKRPELKKALDALYSDYDFKGRLHKDPICLPSRYKDKADIEVAGLIAASLAYGRVGLFLPVATELLDRMGKHPATFAAEAGLNELQRAAKGLSYRFQSSHDLAAFIFCIGKVISAHGGLEAAFMKGFSPGDEDTGSGLAAFMGLLRDVDTSRIYVRNKKKGPYSGLSQLMPSPATGGAAKRGCLYLRWMVRSSDIDFGLWRDVPASRLVIPLDTHIMRVSSCLGLTKRKSPGWATAVEITRSLRAMEPADPLKYDFALCHRGIQGICGKGSCSECDLKRFRK